LTTPPSSRSPAPAASHRHLQQRRLQAARRRESKPSRHAAHRSRQQIDRHELLRHRHGFGQRRDDLSEWGRRTNGRPQRLSLVTRIARPRPTRGSYRSPFGLSGADRRRDPAVLLPAGRTNAAGVCTHSLRLASPNSSILGDLATKIKSALRRPRTIERTRDAHPVHTGGGVERTTGDRSALAPNRARVAS